MEQNGAGKPTILKILTGIPIPTSGNIQISGKITGLFELGTGINPELSYKDKLMPKSKRKYNYISVVTPSFNQGVFLEETISSVLSQEGDFFIDYIINDGGSTDDSPSIILKYEKLLKENCGVIEKRGLQYFVNKNNNFKWNNCSGISYRWVSQKDKGQTDAINKGFQIATGDILAYINSDDVYSPHTFKKIFQVDWDKTDFTYGKGMWIAEKGQPLMLYPTFKPTKYSLFFQCTLCQPTVFIKKETYENMGCFSTEYHCIFDYEYWMRAIFNNKKFYYLNSLLAKSRMYFANKSLLGEDTVKKEASLLHRKYYHKSRVELNKLWLWINKKTVHKKTVRDVLRLKTLLDQN